MRKPLEVWQARRPLLSVLHPRRLRVGLRFGVPLLLLRVPDKLLRLLLLPVKFGRIFLPVIAIPNWAAFFLVVKTKRVLPPTLIQQAARPPLIFLHPWRLPFPLITLLFVTFATSDPPFHAGYKRSKTTIERRPLIPG